MPTAGSCGVAENRMTGGEEDVECVDWFFCTADRRETVEKAIRMQPRLSTPRCSPERQGFHSQKSRPVLRHIPVPLFASVMGLGGLALAWRRAAVVWELPTWPFHVLLGVAGVVFILVAAAYLGKLVRHPDAVRADLTHPIRMAFVPTITISLLILATGLTDLAPDLARVLWWIGAVGHLVATLYVISAWFGRRDITRDTMTPAWLIPIVGNVVTPLAAPAVGNLELAWFSFGVGAIFWLGLWPMLLNRVLVHDNPLPAKLTPTIAIFLAPPSVVALSWQSLTGSLADPVGIVPRHRRVLRPACSPRCPA